MALNIFFIRYLRMKTEVPISNYSNLRSLPYLMYLYLNKEDPVDCSYLVNIIIIELTLRIMCPSFILYMLTLTIVI